MVRVVTDRPNIVRPSYFAAISLPFCVRWPTNKLSEVTGKVELYKSLDYEVGALRTQTRSDVINRDTTL